MLPDGAGMATKRVSKPKTFKTDLQVKALRGDKTGRPYDVKDSETHGLRVRVMPTGQRTFVLLARFPGSPTPTRRALGTYGPMTLEEARDTANHWRKLIKKGVDPAIEIERQRAAEQRKQANTFAAV